MKTSFQHSSLCRGSWQFVQNYSGEHKPQQAWYIDNKIKVWRGPETVWRFVFYKHIGPVDQPSQVCNSPRVIHKLIKAFCVNCAIYRNALKLWIAADHCGWAQDAFNRPFTERHPLVARLSQAGIHMRMRSAGKMGHATKFVAQIIWWCSSLNAKKPFKKVSRSLYTRSKELMLPGRRLVPTPSKIKSQQC